MYVPAWIMQNNRIKEGDLVHIQSVKTPPQATFCRLRPHDHRFADVLLKLGPKYLLESCFRSYSVLEKGQSVAISHQGGSFWVDVTETKPAS